MEPGQGTSWNPPPVKEATGADMMRFPFTGSNNTERMLYYYNKPEVMDGVQRQTRDRIFRKMGISPENPEYRAVPKQRSPFKQ